MIRQQLREDILKIVGKLELKIELDKVEITRPNDPKNGDFSTNLALKLVKGQNDMSSPMELANSLAIKLKDLSYIEKLEVANPGFINFHLKKDLILGQIGEVLVQNEKYGSNEIGNKKKARVEYVSANPTGPLHFGNARGGR